MKEFIISALPLLLAGIGLAILAVSHKQRPHLAAGAGLGLLLGVALNSCGLWHNHLLGLVIGPLWGMVLSSLYHDKKAPENSDGCHKEEK